MLGRQDIVAGPCNDCLGKKIDKRNRKRPCQVCHGSGKKQMCASCGHDMPCPGTDNVVFDQSVCLTKRAGVS